MAEETEILTDRVERIDDRLERWEDAQQDLRTDVAELKGETRQIDRRLTNVEQTLLQMQASVEEGFRQAVASRERNQRWLVGLVLGAWISLMVVMVSILLKV